MTRVVFTADQLEEIARGRFVRVSAGGAGHAGALVGRVGAEWRAYANVCRHRAVPLDLNASSPMSDDGRYLLCHQHGALYRVDDGRCASGPCVGESLESLPIREDDDGALWI
jgi:nitrite reductase/ring-hydroxylating ferredoxin subunit